MEFDGLTLRDVVTEADPEAWEDLQVRTRDLLVRLIGCAIEARGEDAVRPAVADLVSMMTGLPRSSDRERRT
jgi:hypothetical protein